MTTINEPSDAWGLTYGDHVLLRRLIQGGLTKTAIAKALVAPNGTPQEIKAARQMLRELCRDAGTYVPEGRARELRQSTDDASDDSSAITTSDFVEEVIADRHGLSDELCQQGIALWDAAIESLPLISSRNQLQTAPVSDCQEFDLPAGSSWVEVLAAALDAVPAINGTDHLRLLQLAMDEQGLLPDPFDA